MNSLPKLDDISTERVKTSRLEVYLHRSQQESHHKRKASIPIILVHGNLSSGFWFKDLMNRMSDRECLAPDLRGYGQTESLPIDARMGAKTWSDDLSSLMDTLGLEKVHLLGWSAGAAAVMQLMQDRSASVQSLTLLAPVSPYGFGGTKGANGQAVYGDYAGSGGGVVSPEFVKALKEEDTSVENLFSPRNVFRQSYVQPPFIFSNEDELLKSALMQTIGKQHYPGDSSPSNNWPGVAPGIWGPINALSPKYFNLSSIVNIKQKPPIFWVHGSQDSIVSDHSMSDLAVLGSLGYLADWPGIEIFPPQPMVKQTRHVLEAYRQNGGHYQEFIMKNVGHTPHIEQAKTFASRLSEFLKQTEEY